MDNKKFKLRITNKFLFWSGLLLFLYSFLIGPLLELTGIEIFWSFSLPFFGEITIDVPNDSKALLPFGLEIIQSRFMLIVGFILMIFGIFPKKLDL